MMGRKPHLPVEEQLRRAADEGRRFRNRWLSEHTEDCLSRRDIISIGEKPLSQTKAAVRMREYRKIRKNLLPGETRG